MALRVQLNQSPSLSVQVNQPPPINAGLKKIDFELVNLEELNNVDETGLQDGFTIVYDSITQTWKTQLIETGLDANATIDGGGY